MEIDEKTRQHLLLHLQRAREMTVRITLQEEIYEIAQHLGISVKEVNNDLRHDTTEQPR